MIQIEFPKDVFEINEFASAIAHSYVYGLHDQSQIDPNEFISKLYNVWLQYMLSVLSNNH